MLWQDVLSEIADFTKSTTAIFTATDQLSPNYTFCLHIIYLFEACMRIRRTSESIGHALHAHIGQKKRWDGSELLCALCKYASGDGWVSL